MSYSSPIFLFAFLPLVLSAYLALPSLRVRNALLLGASLVFYAWGEGIYVGLLLLSIGANHGFGLCQERLRGTRGGAWTLALALVANLGLLGAFKYAGFAADNLNAVLAELGLPGVGRPTIHLPIGLSFYTFQALSYVLDIHMRGESAQRNPLNTALYVASFPQLILGPIVRYRHIAGEITGRLIRVEDFAEGAGRFIIGLGKKVLIADTIAVAVDAVFAVPLNALTPGLCWLGVAGFALQLYYDFSGYSDMAIGLGRMFGFHFRENFNYPLFARSRSDFFRRWHISFFTWMRDYVYLPLCGTRCPVWRERANSLFVFLLAGIWHGSTWGFIAWGAVNGLVIVAERSWLLHHVQRWWLPLQHAYMLLIHLLSNALFRAQSVEQAWAILLGMVGIAKGGAVPHEVGRFLTADLAAAMVVGAAFSMPIVPWVIAWWRNSIEPRLGPGRGPALAGLAVPVLIGHGAILLAAALVLAARTYTPFVYFQF